MTTLKVPQVSIKISQRQAAIWNLHQLGLITPFTTAGEAVQALVAVQAQDYRAATTAIALRTSQVFEAAALLEASSELVRIWTLRGTLHLVPQAEAAYHQIATAEEWFNRWGKFLNKYLPVSREQVKAELYPRIASALQDHPLGYQQIAVAADLDEPYVRLLPHLMKDLCYLGQCVRGAVDGRGAVYRRANPQALNLTPRAAQSWLVRRFLQRYGPASLADIVYWSGLRVPVVKGLVQEMVPELVSVEIEGQNQSALLLAEQLPLVLSQPQEITLPEQYLPAYDVLLLGYKDKTRFLAAQHLRRVFLTAARVCPTVLRDGRIIGTWCRRESVTEVDYFSG